MDEQSDCPLSHERVRHDNTRRGTSNDYLGTRPLRARDATLHSRTPDPPREAMPSRPVCSSRAAARSSRMKYATFWVRIGGTDPVCSPVDLWTSSRRPRLAPLAAPCHARNTIQVRRHVLSPTSKPEFAASSSGIGSNRCSPGIRAKPRTIPGIRATKKANVASQNTVATTGSDVRSWPRLLRSTTRLPMPSRPWRPC